MQLRNPAKYLPFQNGKYEVGAGLRPFGTDFGNGAVDKCVFQIDSEFPKYRAGKLLARRENLRKYYPEHSGLSRTAESKVIAFLLERLPLEHPDFFTLTREKDSLGLDCALTQEQLFFSPDLELLPELSKTTVAPAYASAFDALAAQLQEDLAIWALETTKDREWLAAIHLCFPNHWAAAEKIGRDFRIVHSPVAGFEKVAQTSEALVNAIVNKGPFVRFAWGVATDDRLNHHPDPAPGIAQEEWSGRAFQPENPALFVRYERQTTQPFPDVGVSLFTIRTYFIDLAATALDPQIRLALAAAIESMSPAQLAYKGLSQSKSMVLDWLR